MATFTIYAQGTDVDVASAYYGYLQRNADGLYFDSDDNTFKTFASLVDGQLEFSEDSDQPGVWSVVVPTSYTGQVTLLPRNSQDDELLIDQVVTAYLIDGDLPVDPRDALTPLYEHFGSLNSLQFVTDNGEAISGATIQVYTKAAFDASNYDNVLGTTTTNLYGYWTNPIFVPNSNTYTVVFSKEGDYETESVNVTVP